jgi:hypothetical protein
MPAPVHVEKTKFSVNVRKKYHIYPGHRASMDRFAEPRECLDFDTVDASKNSEVTNPNLPRMIVPSEASDCLDIHLLAGGRRCLRLIYLQDMLHFF